MFDVDRLIAGALEGVLVDGGRQAGTACEGPAGPYEEPPSPRMIALCYPRDRPVTATARTLISAIRAQAA